MDDNHHPRPPPGQRSEVTSPTLAIVGALLIVAIGILAFSFWPDSPTLKTDASGTAPEKPGTPGGATRPQ